MVGVVDVLGDGDVDTTGVSTVAFESGAGVGADMAAVFATVAAVLSVTVLSSDVRRPLLPLLAAWYIPPPNRIPTRVAVVPAGGIIKKCSPRPLKTTANKRPPKRTVGLTAVVLMIIQI